MHYIIVPMRQEDIPQVVEIEKEACLSPWPENAYRQELKNNGARYLVATEANSIEGAPPSPQSVGETALATNASPSRVERLLAGVRGLFRRPMEPPPESRPILGFLGMWYLFNESHVTTLAVRKECHRQGVGESLMLQAVDLALELGTEVVTLEVRVSNLAAQALYRKLGFSQVGLRRGYYTDNREDALLMSTENITSAPFQAAFQRLKAENARRRQAGGDGLGLFA